MARITRQESKVLTRQRLREAASEEFRTHGVAGSSIDRITEAAGFSRGAFYSNYTSKSELALELISDNNARDIAQWRTMIDTLKDPVVLMGELRAHFERVTRHPEWAMLRLELRMDAQRDGKFRELYDASNAELMLQLKAMVRALSRASDCEATTDVDYVAQAVFAFTHGLQVDFPVEVDRPTKLGDLLVRLLFDLLGRPAKLAHFFNPVATQGDHP